MNYEPLDKPRSAQIHWTAEISQGLWQWTVFLGLLVMGAVYLRNLS